MSIVFSAVTDDCRLVEPPEMFSFPGGEHHLRCTTPLPDRPIHWVADVRGADPNDLVKAALLADYVAREREERIDLLLPYLPAARADRGAPLGAEVYATFVNSVGAETVVGIDPHSEVITHQIAGLRLADPVPLIVANVAGRGYDGVIAPDHGAVDRASAAAAALGIDLYQAVKHRDFDTGKITGIAMEGDLPASGKYLIVDDICDGGGTFRGLADATKLPREQLGLWVTHGIFSGAAHDLGKDYAEIITTTSHPGHDRHGVATLIVPVLTALLAETRKVAA